ncbi:MULTISPECIES: hypothetical protein [unclassified Streptomyces]|uniref:hypothetical protein n=1 Tax=unclassified Streptomyces TaxID=2593676 RepID=UPI0009596B76|nr:hypothetical protein [Streptomyces sp. TSRI0107]OKJ79642.1 hypothetical protein AMK31_26745 [Streptomyces sp. TSRI0107]
MAAAAGLGGVLLLSACSDDGGSEDAVTPTSSASAPASPSASAPESAGPSGAGRAELQGSWLATTGGQAVALVITGDDAGLFASRGAVCSGQVGEAAGKPTIRLRCGGGDEERGTGTVDSATATALEVTWEGTVGTETYTKAEGGKLPSGLPTAP